MSNSYGETETTLEIKVEQIREIDTIQRMRRPSAMSIKVSITDRQIEDLLNQWLTYCGHEHLQKYFESEGFTLIENSQQDINEIIERRKKEIEGLKK